jgi:hypothetical protein
VTVTLDALQGQTSTAATLPIRAARPVAGEVRVHVWTTVSERTTPAATSTEDALLVTEGVSRALRVRIYQDDDVVIVEDLATGIYGDAENLADAVRDFGVALRQHLSVLESEELLSPDLQRQLSVLRSYMTP